MDKPLTIQIPEDLEQQLIVRATGFKCLAGNFNS
jgi:hypothetical protein